MVQIRSTLLVVVVDVEDEEIATIVAVSTAERNMTSCRPMSSKEEVKLLKERRNVSVLAVRNRDTFFLNAINSWLSRKINNSSSHDRTQEMNVNLTSRMFLKDQLTRETEFRCT